MNLTERAAYLKGLADGVELDATTKEGKLISALIELVSDMADEIAEMDERIDTAFAYCEELDEDLGEVEEILLDECDCDECEHDAETCEDEDCDCCEDQEVYIMKIVQMEDDMEEFIPVEDESLMEKLIAIVQRRFDGEEIGDDPDEEI